MLHSIRDGVGVQQTLIIYCVAGFGVGRAQEPTVTKA
jgi:hypothetical protein